MNRHLRSTSMAVALAAVTGLAIGRASAQAPAAVDDDTRVPTLAYDAILAMAMMSRCQSSSRC